MDPKQRHLNSGLQHLLLLLFSSVMLLPFLGSVHLFDWDEINFAESAREMLLTGNYLSVQIDFEPFWEKPPFFFWLQALSMKIFGVNEFAARLPNALAGILSLQLMMFIGRKHGSPQLALLWPLIYLASLTPFFYFKSGIIDPWFNLWIFCAVYALFRSTQNQPKSLRYFFFAGLFLGMAFLTKGPVAILLAGLSGFIWWLSQRFRKWFRWNHLLVLIVGIVMIPLLWLAPEIQSRGFWFIQSFIGYQIELLREPVASHGQPWFYHPLVLLFGAFPASVFAFPMLLGKIRNHERSAALDRWMRILFWVVLLVFSAVTTKIVHYSSMCFLPLTWLAARSFENSEKVRNKAFLLFVGLILSSLFIALPLMMSSDEARLLLMNTVKDKQVRAALKIDGNWSPLMAIPGMLLLVIYIYISFKKTNVALSLMLLPFIYNVAMRTLVPAVEAHSQRPIIGFYQSVSQMDVYLVPYRFKTYAHLFYGNVKEPKLDDPLLMFRKKWKLENGLDPNTSATGAHRKKLADAETKWLIEHAQEKDVYFICLDRKAPELAQFPKLKPVFSQGGTTVFLKESLTPRN